MIARPRRRAPARVSSADIFCPKIDLSARARIHYGRRQIILREWIDPCLFHHVQCKTSDTRVDVVSIDGLAPEGFAA